MTRINAFFVPPDYAPESAVEGVSLIEGMIARVEDLKMAVDRGVASQEQINALEAGKDVLKQWGRPCGTLWFGWHAWACSAQQSDKARVLRGRLLTAHHLLCLGDSYRAPVFDRVKIAQLFRLPDDALQTVMAAMKDQNRCWQMAAWCKKQWVKECEYIKSMLRTPDDAGDDEPETLSALDRACMHKESYDMEEL